MLVIIFIIACTFIFQDFGTGSNEPVIIHPQIPTTVKNSSYRITSLDAFRG